MKNYEKKIALNFFFIVIFISCIIFFYCLKNVKIWTFKSYNIVLTNENYIKVACLVKEEDSFKDNKFLYYNNKKVSYKIKSKEKINDLIILDLELNVDLKIRKDDMNILLPNTKKSVFSLIVESWRLK